MKKIILTGGGSAGHVTPNIALLPKLAQEGYEVVYIGSHQGIEKRLIADYPIRYESISSGKFRRYFDLKNLTDPFRVIKGYGEAKRLLKSYAPDVVFSKGGFVSVPVVLAANALNIPCVIHESDMTPGLANRLCQKAAQKICCNFPETLKMLPADKAVLTGSPIREELYRGNRLEGLRMCGFSANEPVILVMGGSLGAAGVNRVVREALPRLLQDFQVVHLCGKDKVDNLLLNTRGYKQFEYIKEGLKDLFAIADIVISRAGANAICELLALKKPNILIPLPGKSSRGDQILNAKSFQSQGFSLVVDEEEMTADLLTDRVHELYFTKQTYIDAMSGSNQMDSISTIIQLIKESS
ncbi:MAG: undecaprenyldiphospho-muramoylpentapeptide beta-N-acetylglucosaminyltransferase [Lachnospiraceae bacterium]|nr:undecaprenyldiphospho-muramoylpentapeptide beta-N-acetylglucosaminyltransferase [Lachnospiraceae bacterium]